MFVLNEDMSIYLTRGDIMSLSIPINESMGIEKLNVGDILRFKVFKKKSCDEVVMQKDFAITEETTTINIYLEKEYTKIGEIINKPREYWYEIELNPDTVPQTIVGYDEGGAKVLTLMPEGGEVYIDPEDIETGLTKTIVISDESTDNQIPTAKAVSNELEKRTIRTKIILQTSAALSSYSGAMGGYVGTVDITSNLPDNTIAIIPISCYQNSGNSSLGVLAKNSTSMTSGSYRINGNAASSYVCVFLVLYTAV